MLSLCFSSVSSRHLCVLVHHLSRSNQHRLWIRTQPARLREFGPPAAASAKLAGKRFHDLVRGHRRCVRGPRGNDQDWPRCGHQHDDVARPRRHRRGQRLQAIRVGVDRAQDDAAGAQRFGGRRDLVRSKPRQFFLSAEYSYSRKLTEIFLALKMERELSKA